MVDLVSRALGRAGPAGGVGVRGSARERGCISIRPCPWTREALEQLASRRPSPTGSAAGRDEGAGGASVCDTAGPGRPQGEALRQVWQQHQLGGRRELSRIMDIDSCLNRDFFFLSCGSDFGSQWTVLIYVYTHTYTHTHTHTISRVKFVLVLEPNLETGQVTEKNNKWKWCKILLGHSIFVALICMCG